MKDEALINLALEAREEFLGGECPRGECYGVSEAVLDYLVTQGIEAKMFVVDHRQKNLSRFNQHAFIKLGDGRVLDPTFDTLYDSGRQAPVYLGKPTYWHRGPSFYGDNRNAA